MIRDSRKRLIYPFVLAVLLLFAAPAQAHRVSASEARATMLDRASADCGEGFWWLCHNTQPGQGGIEVREFNAVGDHSWTMLAAYQRDHAAIPFHNLSCTERITMTHSTITEASRSCHR